MGLMTIGIGLAIGWPQTVATVIPAISIYACHHALAKGALFLGIGIIGTAEGSRTAGRLAAGGMIFASLALAGAPLTSGAVAKIALKIPLKTLQGSWISGLNWLLPLAAIGTTLLMSRLIFMVTSQTANHGKPKFGMWLSWTLTIFLTATTVWLMPAARAAVSDALRSVSLWQSLWPVAAAILISVVVGWKVRRNKWSISPEIPQGDMLVAISYLCRMVFESSFIPTQRMRQSISLLLKYFQRTKLPIQAIRQLPFKLENWLTDWRTAGLIFILLTGSLFIWALV
jgi:hypothetical protein